MAADDIDGLFGSESDGSPERPIINDEHRDGQSVEVASGLADSLNRKSSPDRSAPGPADTDAMPQAERDMLEDDLEDGLGAGARNDEPATAHQHDASVGEPLHLSANLHALPDAQALRLVKLSNVLGIDTKPFDEHTFKQEYMQSTDSRGQATVTPRHQHNTIRWRVAENATTSAVVKESNARLVKWSDGSWQMFLGEEVLDVDEQDIKSQNMFLYANCKFLMQGQAQLGSKLVLRPHSLQSGVHRKIMAGMDAQRMQRSQGKVKSTINLKDPEAETKEKEREAEKHIRDNERLRAKQMKKMSAYDRPTQRSMQTGGARMDAAFLDQEDDYGGSDGEGGPRLSAADEAAAEAVGEGRLRAIKHTAAERGGGLKRQRLDSEDDMASEDEKTDGLTTKGQMLMSDSD